MPLDVTSTTEEKVKLHIAPVTSTGKPAAVDGIPVWSIIEGGATIEAAADGLSADVISEDNAGTSVWNVQADADLGEGVVFIEDGGSYVYNNPMAASMGTTADAPVPKGTTPSPERRGKGRKK
jgi:hypothetical protein